jgi:hypothetical protein
LESGVYSAVTTVEMDDPAFEVEEDAAKRAVVV